MKTIEQYEKILKKDRSLTVELRQETKTRKAIYVLTPDPHATRKHMVKDTGPTLGITFATPRKTKATGYMLGIVQDDTDEVYLVKIRKGGIFNRGRQNEVSFQQYIKNQIEESGECRLVVSDNYGKTVELDIVDVVDTSGQHGKVNRADTTLKLRDGSTYGISQKKTNANIVAKVTKLLKHIIFQTEQKIRQYAIRNRLEPKSYTNFRITNREFIDLCWFGTDIAKGAVFIGDLEDISSNEIHIERIIENGDDDVLNSFPIYIKWQIRNKAYTMDLFGVVVDRGGTIKTIDDLELPGINAPLPSGKKFKVDETLYLESRRRDDMWDTVAWCAENHKMLWLKYETVDDGEIISRKVAPYSYRTRRTKVRGKSTYFYADDFTPGEEHGIKCFLIDNCLQVKKSAQSFTPRWSVEIKQEIDRMDREMQDKERDKEKKKLKDKRPEAKPKKTEPVKKPAPAPKPEPKKPIEKPEVKKPEVKKPEPKPDKKPAPVKVSKPKVEPDKPTPEPSKKPLPPPEKKSPDKSSKDEPEDDNVKITDEPEPEDDKSTAPSSMGEDEDLSSDQSEQEQQKKDGEVQITDDDGNVLEQETTWRLIRPERQRRRQY